MTKSYWEEYYKNRKATDFAKFCVSYLDKNDYIVDVGCGNGRDTRYFNELHYPTLGIDYASDYGLKMSLKELMGRSYDYNVIYSRFFLHCLSKSEIVDFLAWSRGRKFMAEFRVKGDEPKLFKDHERNLIDLGWLEKEIRKRNFKIVYSVKGRNMAKYKSENPLVGRVICIPLTKITS